MRSFFYYIASLCIVTSNLYAHQDHHWLSDFNAYHQVRIEPNFLMPKNFFEYTYADIDMLKFQSNLEKFSGANTLSITEQVYRLTDRYTTTNKEISRQFLRQELEKMGYAVQLHTYSGGINLVAEKKGISEKVLIISSHYDSIRNVAGANDDGTGSVGLLAIADALQTMDFNHTVKFVFFDQEESGLLGSKQYVTQLLREYSAANIIGDIQLEMFGYHAKNDGKFHVIDCSKASSVTLTNEIMSAVTSLNLPLQRVSTCTDRSDHGSFWLKNIPAIVISENFFGGDGDPCYHKSCDKADARINYNYIHNISLAVSAAVIKILEPI